VVATPTTTLQQETTTQSTAAAGVLDTPGLAQDVGVGADGSVWIIGRTPVAGGFNIAQLVRNEAGGWSEVKIGGGAVRVAVDPQGSPWVVNEPGNLYQYDKNNKRWKQVLTGAAWDVGVGADGSVWITGRTLVAGGLNIAQLVQDEAGGWSVRPTDHGGVGVSVGPEGRAWYIDDQWSVHVSDRPATTTAPTTTTSAPTTTTAVPTTTTTSAPTTTPTLPATTGGGAEILFDAESGFEGVTPSVDSVDRRVVDGWPEARSTEYFASGSAAYRLVHWWGPDTPVGMAPSPDHRLTLNGSFLVGASARLSFQSRRNTWPGEHARVEISSDGGVSWSVLEEKVGADGGTLEAGFSAWTIDLAAYEDQTIRLRFNYHVVCCKSVGGYQEVGADEGWFIDDIRLTGVTVP
jgi:hypothetical protein